MPKMSTKSGAGWSNLQFHSYEVIGCEGEVGDHSDLLEIKIGYHAIEHPKSMAILDVAGQLPISKVLNMTNTGIS
jgi:hypothetical protein